MKSKPTHHVVYVLAQIHGAECFDMFRYMNCVPATEREAHALTRAVTMHEAAWIVLKRFVPTCAEPLADWERWKSFNIPSPTRSFSEIVDAEDFRQKQINTGVWRALE